MIENWQKTREVDGWEWWRNSDFADNSRKGDQWSTVIDFLEDIPDFTSIVEEVVERESKRLLQSSEEDAAMMVSLSEIASREDLRLNLWEQVARLSESVAKDGGMTHAPHKFKDIKKHDLIGFSHFHFEYGQLKGFLLVDPDPGSGLLPEESISIEKLGVQDGFREQGVATRFLNRLAEKAKAEKVALIEVSVLRNNQKVIEWYKKFGFNEDHHLLEIFSKHDLLSIHLKVIPEDLLEMTNKYLDEQGTRDEAMTGNLPDKMRMDFKELARAMVQEGALSSQIKYVNDYFNGIETAASDYNRGGWDEEYYHELKSNIFKLFKNVSYGSKGSRLLVQFLEYKDITIPSKGLGFGIDLIINNIDSYVKENPRRMFEINPALYEFAALLKQAFDSGSKGEKFGFQSDDADLPEKKPGGIDFNPANLNMRIQRDDAGMPLPWDFQTINNLQIEGLTPVIINVVPITNLPLLLGQKSESSDELAYL